MPQTNDTKKKLVNCHKCGKPFDNRYSAVCSDCFPSPQDSSMIPDTTLEGILELKEWARQELRSMAQCEIWSPVNLLNIIIDKSYSLGKEAGLNEGDWNAEKLVDAYRAGKEVGNKEGIRMQMEWWDKKCFVQGRQAEREEVAKMIKNLQFKMNVEDYLPKVEAWNKSNYDVPFDDGYAQAKSDFLSALSSLTKKG